MNRKEKLIDKELEKCIKISLDKIYKKHDYLIKEKIHERSIVFWFGIYFYECLQKTDFKKYDLDFEYNRNLSGVKRTENFQEGTYPDLILHTRGSNDDNILIMEFKTWWNNNKKRDMKKLKDFLSLNGNYKYKYGAFIVFGKEKSKVRYL